MRALRFIVAIALSLLIAFMYAYGFAYTNQFFIMISSIACFLAMLTPYAFNVSGRITKRLVLQSVVVALLLMLVLFASFVLTSLDPLGMLTQLSLQVFPFLSIGAIVIGAILPRQRTSS